MLDTVFDPVLEAKRQKSIKILCDEFRKYNTINPELYDKFNVKRGLRNKNGTGVIAGLTHICNVHGYIMDESEKVPIDGELIYRGYNINDIVKSCKEENRFGFEEVVWLLLFGSLPSPRQLEIFCETLSDFRELPDSFIDDIIIKAPSPNIMNKLSRCILALYSYDENADDTSLENVMRQCVEIIAKLPTMMVYSYQVKKRYYDKVSMYLHPNMPHLNTAANILSTIRDNREFSDEEAKLLDLALILHAEHGGGNNSAFTCRVLSSSGTDTYAAIAGAIGSLKGPRHGGANNKVMEMIEYFKNDVADWNDDAQIKDYLYKIMRKEGGDRSGLIYGIGHAIYTKSDPRAVLLKENAAKLVCGSECEKEFILLDAIERLAPEVFADQKGDVKTVCPNVDLYSGIVYKLLGIPAELYTPLFAVARIGGWCAHRIEELTTCSRIMRPAYKSISAETEYIPLSKR